MTNSRVCQCLTSLSEDDSAKVTILRLLQDVCSASGELPSSYWLEGVTVRWKDCIGNGGEALIFLGSLQDQAVVARQVRRPGIRGWASEAGREALRVCRASPLSCSLSHLPRRQYIRREIIMHAQLDHPNVIPFLGVFKENDEDEAPMIVLPFMESGSAMDFLNQLENAEAEIAISSIVGQLILHMVQC